MTPLPVAHESPRATFDYLPSVPIFSSDYPHFQGSPDPIGHYRTELEPLDDESRAAFLGGNLADCFARMGDPITT